MDAEEMIGILEALIRDPDTNPTAKCTAIRALREIAPEPPKDGVLAELDEFRPRRILRKATEGPDR
jgi:hypothetical protein